MSVESVTNFKIPKDVLIHHIAKYLDNISLFSLACSRKDNYDALQELLISRRESLLHAKEVRKIFKSLRTILYKYWNPMHYPGLPENGYDGCIPDFFTEAIEKEVITASFIEILEFSIWNMRRTSEAVKESVAKKINNLRIKERTNFKDPYDFNQLGLLGTTIECDCFFVYRCFAAALVLDPSFLRAKRNILEFKRRRGNSIRRRGNSFESASFFGVSEDAINEVLRELL